MTTAYLGLDLHANSSTPGVMAEDGTYQGHQQFSTAESELVPRVSSIDASEKRLAVEASSLSRWAARTLDPYVDQTVVCDARENHLISRDARKGDISDAYNLCRLLRLQIKFGATKGSVSVNTRSRKWTFEAFPRGIDN